MTILCAGINHRDAALEIREKFVIGDHELQETLDNLRSIEGLSGAVVVSTCNRVELYASSLNPLPVMTGIRHFLKSRTSGLEAPFFTEDSLPSVKHLFRVASGLDSMVVGETEILGQLKQAYSAAANHGATNTHLNKLFQHAFRVAKQVRTETNITRGATSVGSVAVDLAGKIFGDLGGRKVMILGAGDTSERVARSLVSRGVRTVIVANRTFDRAAALADQIGGLAVHFDHWHTAFDEVDILICSTAAPHPIVTREKLEPILRRHSERPLFIIDLAVPRDVDASVNELENVYLYDIDSIEEIARQSLNIRQAEIVRCEALIDTHVADFMHWMRNHPTPSR
jgi:glutamyl-tRNA reductase